MYDWLRDALHPPATVVTANRRLARVLRQEFANGQIRDGNMAWPSPAIHAWPDWLALQLDLASDQVSLPVRLNVHQSRVLWERCLAKESADLAGFANLIRLSRESWQRLADWQVPIRDVAKSAQNDDQRLFARVAGRYLGILEREAWVDDAGIAALVHELIEADRVPTEGRYTFAGFDREAPVVSATREALETRGCEVCDAGRLSRQSRARLAGFDNKEAELRAAGAWAHEVLSKNAASKVAIVASDLEQQAVQATRLVSEGLVPGWQYADASVAQAVNVSYGRKLSEYPAIAIAMLMLRWLVRDLGAADIGHLLRSPLLAEGATGGRCRLELKLRQLPDRDWSPAMVSSALSGERDDAPGWQRLVAEMSKWRRELPRHASPARWSLFIDGVLKACGWPGESALSSHDFQLVNRWRELLNELARLDLVSPSMTLAAALARLEQMSGEIVFQPESRSASVQLLGPLESSGAEFDAVWITGLTAAHWPAAGWASPLISRSLQRHKKMPGADPADTLEYAESLLRGFEHCADEVVFSYPLNADDAEQTPSNLLRKIEPEAAAVAADPGWHATQLVKRIDLVRASEAAPAILPDEKLAGGAATIQRQLIEPLAAFLTGRLGVKLLQPQASGISPAMRGNVVHDVLCRLYSGTPSKAEISAWAEAELDRRLDEAIQAVLVRHERNTDSLLFELLRLERQRTKVLLRRFVRVDSEREDFEVAAVEREVDFSEASVRLKLRVDRIDRAADGSLAIIDYKTGAKRSFLKSDGQPADIQLIAYAGAVDEPVSSLVLAYIDSRDIVFTATGSGHTDEEEWADQLGGWQQIVRQACDDMSRGDVRINALQSARDARFLNLLSRFTELRRDA